MFCKSMKINKGNFQTVGIPPFYGDVFIPVLRCHQNNPLFSLLFFRASARLCCLVCTHEKHKYIQHSVIHQKLFTQYLCDEIFLESILVTLGTYFLFMEFRAGHMA